jgi:hypothetical protein
MKILQTKQGESKNVIELFSLLPENERIIVDVIRQIICEGLPA